jgi:hypothetical protein
MLERRNAEVRRILALVNLDYQSHVTLAGVLIAEDVIDPKSSFARHLGQHFLRGHRPEGAEKDGEDADDGKGKNGISTATVVALGGAAIAGALAWYLKSGNDQPDANDLKKSWADKFIDYFTSGKDHVLDDTIKYTPPPSVTSDTTTSSTPSKEPKATSPLAPTPRYSSPSIGKEKPTSVRTSKPSEAILAAIRSGSTKAGTDTRLMYAFAGVESSFRGDVDAGTSSAQGLYQFTEGTWSDMMKRYPSLKYTMEDRKDPEKASYVAGLYINSLQKKLAKVLGRPPSMGEIYLSYFLGENGGPRFLREMMANPNGIAADSFPTQAKANRNVFYSGDTALTYAQVLAKFEGKIGSYAADYSDDGTQVAKASVPVSPPMPTDVKPQQTASTNVQGLPKLNVATSTPISPAVSLPTSDITNKKKQGDKMVEAISVGSTSQTTKQPVVAAMAEDHKHNQPMRGRDGRLYQIS